MPAKEYLLQGNMQVEAPSLPADSSALALQTTGNCEIAESVDELLKVKKCRNVRNRPTLTACTNCRQAKSKCTGERSICSRCQKRGFTCTYDVLIEGVTRLQDLRNKLGEQAEQLDQAEKLLGAFQNQSEDFAMHILVQLRNGGSMAFLLEQIDQQKNWVSSQNASLSTPSRSRGPFEKSSSWSSSQQVPQQSSTTSMELTVCPLALSNRDGFDSTMHIPLSDYVQPQVLAPSIDYWNVPLHRLQDISTDDFPNMLHVDAWVQSLPASSNNLTTVAKA